MPIPKFLRPILDDDSLTRGLGDEEARMLIEWLVEQGERIADEVNPTRALAQVCRRAKSISRFVELWCYRGLSGAAAQLANAERVHWPLPNGPIEPIELMQDILNCENAPTANWVGIP